MKYKKRGRRILATLVSMAMAFNVFSGVAEADDSGSTTTVQVAVTYHQTQARSMLEMINEFRTGNDAWYWNADDTTTTLKNLSELTYDYTLEKIAMQRAAEIALSFSHTRTDGTTCWTAYDDYSYTGNSVGENIAVGSKSAKSIFTLWQETNSNYSGQGHRRNILSSSFSHVGIACVYYNGTYYWVQEFAKPSGASANTAETTANDGETTVKVNVLDKYFNGVVKGADGKWGYYTGGILQKNYTGFQTNNKTWYIENGYVTFTKNGVIKDSATGRWYYVTGSKVQSSYTGVANYSNAYGWWYIKSGKVDFSFNGKASNKYGKWDVINGKVVF